MMIGVDIGGTFTDTVLFDEKTQQCTLIKLPSTPKNYSIGVENSIKRALQLGMKPEEVTFFAHACTVATNTIIEKKGAKTALFITKGFECVLQLGRKRRPDPYDFYIDISEPIVPRSLVKGVSERVNSKGEIIKPLNKARTLKAIQEIRDAKVEAVAICFLFSFLNPKHEKEVAEMIKGQMPDVILTLSSELIPEFREYERASTTVVNAYVAPIVSRYISRLEESILKFGIPSKLHLMESSGGIVSADLVKSKPAFMIESGPAGGVIEAAFLGKQAGYNNMVTFDMGGTTAKMGLIEDGNITTTSNFEVGAVARAGKRMGGSGYPVKLPFIELIEIGAGGGSIAWIDSGNMLRVGPQSAGADPGPACYNIGGTEPTVTDANVVLGRINSNYFLGGEIELDATKSHEAIKEKIADVLGMDLMEAAQGIIDITNANMLRSLKVVTTGRGIDPRDYVLIAFGGAGPVCAAELGKELGVCQVLIPKTASVHSALGLLVSDIRHDFLRTKKERIADINFKSLTNSYQELENQAHATLMKENIPENKMSFVRSVDMRYIGQSYELRVPVPGGELNGEKMNDVLKSFHDLHLRTYAHNMTDQPLEIVTIRVAGFGETLKPPMKRNKKEGKSPEHSFKYKRPVYFKELGKVIQCSCFDGDKLMTGNTISGPAIIEEKFTTMIVPPDCEAEMDEYTNMVISVKK